MLTVLIRALVFCTKRKKHRKKTASTYEEKNVSHKKIQEDVFIAQSDVVDRSGVFVNFIFLVLIVPCLIGRQVDEGSKVRCLCVR